LRVIKKKKKWQGEDGLPLMKDEALRAQGYQTLPGPVYETRGTNPELTFHPPTPKPYTLHLLLHYYSQA